LCNKLITVIRKLNSSNIPKAKIKPENEKQQTYWRTGYEENKEGFREEKWWKIALDQIIFDTGVRIKLKTYHRSQIRENYQYQAYCAIS